VRCRLGCNEEWLRGACKVEQWLEGSFFDRCGGDLCADAAGCAFAVEQGSGFRHRLGLLHVAVAVHAGHGVVLGSGLMRGRG
jgi:hypothetical protein